ncbi:putative ribonuclease H-like domain-containing protein [Tanacetum coccineum]
MLADSYYLTFWAEAVSTACYVQNRVLVTKPHNKTPYELLHGRPHSISFMRPFRCPVTTLNTLDPLGKFDEKADEGFFVGYTINSKVVKSSKDAVADDAGKKTNEESANEGERNGQEKEGGASNKKDDQNVQDFRVALDNLLVQQKKCYANNTNRDSNVSPSVSTAGQSFTNADDLPTDPLMPDLEDTANLLNTGIFSGAYDDEDVGAEADLNNLETTINVSPIPTTRIHKDHPKDQIIGDINSTTQTRRMTKISEELAMKVWRLVDLPKAKHAIGTKWVYINKKYDGGIVVRNKARLVAQGYTQKEGINYDEVFAPVARIEAIRLFLAYASFMGFIMYQMDVKSAFLYSTIEEEVYVCQPPGFEDPQFPDKVYMVYVDDIIFGSTKKSLCVEFESLMHKKFQMSSMRELTFFLGLQVMQRDDGIFISQDKSMIGSLMYLTASRPDIMFVVCACARFQVTPKVSHLHVVKRILRYLKGQPKLGLWYPKDSPFDLEAFSDSDYAGASLDRKSTTRGCQFLGKRLISWQCKKQTVVANSTTEAYTICIVKNPVFHFKTKHIEIRHHFIRDSYEKRLIQVIKIHTDHNVADLLTKAFDVSSIRDKFGNKTGSCKVNTARQAKHIEYMVLNASPLNKILKRGRDTKIPQFGGPPEKVGDEAVHKELSDRMERVATTASSLEAEQDSGSGPRCQNTILGVVDAKTRIGVDTARHKLNTASIKLVMPGADYANLGYFIYKRKKGEKGNEKKKDVEGLFLYKSQTFP